MADVFFNFEQEEAEQGGFGDRPDPGSYYALIETCRETTDNNQIPVLDFIFQIEGAKPDKAQSVGKQIPLRVQLPHPGIRDGSIRRLAMICKRLQLLPADGWGKAAKAYPGSFLAEKAQGLPCFLVVEESTWNNAKTGKEMKGSQIAFDGVYGIDDSRMEDLFDLVDGSDGGGGRIDDI